MILSPKRKLLRIITVFVIFAFILIISGCVESKSKELPKNLTNSLGMEFVLIPAGEYQMGSPSYTGKLFDSDSPVHNVTIKKPFYMSKYEVTQKEWLAIAPYNPSEFPGDNLPVDNVTIPEMRSYILKLNLQEKVGDSQKYRLPTEAEWEYACRAGTTTRFFFGDENEEIDKYGWSGNNSNGTTHPVGLKLPNPWGLYDMYGNVWELTQDAWHSNYTGAPADGSAWSSKNPIYVVGRGGSWDNGPNLCTSRFRGCTEVDQRVSSIGFRLVKDI